MGRVRTLTLPVWTTALALAAVLAACGSDDPATDQAGTAGQSPPTTVAAAGAAQPAASTTQPPAATVAKATNDRFGSILVDANGRTLYTFDRDTVGDGYEVSAASACNGGCAQTWPPLLVASASVKPTAGPGVALPTTFPRDDGATQVAVSGKPLYLYAADTKPGDVTGDGVGGVWHVAKG